jgi:DNA-binding LacI/PurR family transcriptional regulator
MTKRSDGTHDGTGRVTLKDLATHLGLDPATVSVVLNEVPGRSIPQHTRERIKAAARELNYQPNHVARALRSQRALAVGVLVPELGDGYHTQVLRGASALLLEQGYFYFIAQHAHEPEMVQQYAQMLLSRGAEGLLVIDTALETTLPVPAVAVAGHRTLPGVTNVVLDHRLAAELSLGHLRALGHTQIAFMRGQPFSSDSADRWRSTEEVAHALGLEVQSDLVVQLDRDINSPELGYPVVEQLLRSGKRFTALVAFNDLSAIGAVRALQDKGLRVPDDISVIGFDDIRGAAFHNPSLTTIRQPLEKMGRLAAERLMAEVLGPKHKPATQAPEACPEVSFAPELVVRESTGPASGS